MRADQLLLPVLDFVGVEGGPQGVVLGVDGLGSSGDKGGGGAIQVTETGGTRGPQTAVFLQQGFRHLSVFKVDDDLFGGDQCLQPGQGIGGHCLACG